MYLGDCLSPRCSAGWKTALGAQAIVLQHPSTVQAAKHSTLCPAWQQGGTCTVLLSKHQAIPPPCLPSGPPKWQRGFPG